MRIRNAVTGAEYSSPTLTLIKKKSWYSSYYYDEDEEDIRTFCLSAGWEEVTENGNKQQ